MINKKVILKIIFLTSIVFLLSIIFRSENAKAATATSKVNGVTWTYTYTTGGTEATNVYTTTRNLRGELVIPEKLGGYTVTSIGNGSVTIVNGSTSSYRNNGNSSITKVVIPSGVKKINKGTFYKFTALKEISGMENVTEIGNEAFCDNSALTKITLPNSIQKIGTWTFYGCYRATGDLIIPESVEELSNGAFRGCTGLNGNLVINSSKLVSIPNYTFSGCKNLKIKLPSTIKSVGSYAFDGQKDIWVDNVEGNISFASNFGANNPPFVHYKGCKHKITFNLLEGIKVVDADTNEEITSGEYECGSNRNLKIVVENGYTYNNLVIEKRMQGDYTNSDDVSSKIDGTTFSINNLLRATTITTRNLNNGLDLSLRTYIDSINGNELEVSRAPRMLLSTASPRYLHTKYPLVVNTNDEILYKVKIYNEGKTAGSADQITVHLPEGLEFIKDNENNVKYNWTISDNGKTITTEYYKNSNILGYTGIGLPDSKTLEIVCKVTANKSNDKSIRLTNIAEISAQSAEDADSVPNNVVISDLENYKRDDALNSNSASYIEGQEDDDDFENVVVLREIPVTYSIKISKVDNKTLELLDGAKFNLLDEEGNILQTKVTVQNGTLTFAPITTYGAGTDTYYISEIETPEGYKAIIEDKIKVEVIKTILDPITESYDIKVVCDLLETYVNTTIDESSVIPIYTKQQLKKLGNDEIININGTSYEFSKDKNYRLMSDIDLSNEEWEPIKNNLTGIFDGNNHSITGLTITDKTNKEIGLFANFSGIIENLKLDDVNINIDISNEIDKIKKSVTDSEEQEKQIDNLVNSYKVGGLIGNMQGGAILNTTVNGTIKSTSSNVGGFVGYEQTGYMTIIKNSVNNSTVQTSYYNAGGFIGASYSALTIKDCNNTGAITAGKYNSAGFAGYVESDGYTSKSVQTKYDKTTNTIDVVIGNAKKDGYYTITLRKVDSEDANKLLDGSKFSVYDENKNIISGLENLELTNGSITLDKIKIENSGKDTYYLKEVSAPDGYQIIEDYIKVQLNKNWDGVNSKYIISVNDELNNTQNGDNTQTLQAKSNTGIKYDKPDDVVYPVNKASIVNCTNSGNITSNIGNASGFIAKSKCIVNISNCKNEENTTIVSANHSAGFLSEAEEKDENTILELNNCNNYATINIISIQDKTMALSKDASGIVSYTKAKTRIINSNNNGNINAEAGEKGTSAGIIANAENEVIINECNNKGEILAKEDASGILAKSINRNKKVTIKLSTNTGKISGEGNVSGIASTISNEKIVIEDCKNNNSTIIEKSNNTGLGVSAGILALTSSDVILKNCSVEQTSMQNNASETIAGILGYAGGIQLNGKSESPVNVEIYDCSAKDLTIISDSQRKSAIAGKIIDRFNGGIKNIVIKGCTAENIKFEGQKYNVSTTMIVGEMDEVTNVLIENCIAKNSTIQVEDNNYYSGSQETGMIAGIIMTNSQDLGEININNCNVENINIDNNAGGHVAGIIGYIEGGKPTGVNITNCNVNNTSLSARNNGQLDVSAIVGSAIRVGDINLNNCKSENNTFNSKGYSGGYLTQAGLVGFASTQTASFENCDVKNTSLTTYGGKIAGLVGGIISSENSNDFIINFEKCNVIDTTMNGRTDENGVYGVNEAGGLVALVDEASVKIKDCEIKSTDANNKLNISGNCYIGGVVGFAKRGVILENVKASNLNIKSTGDNLVAGGIAHASGKVVAKECILNNIDIANNNRTSGFMAYNSSFSESTNIENCEFSNININVANSYVTGGIVAVTENSVYSSNSKYNNIKITAGEGDNASIGGIACITKNEFKMKQDAISNITVINNRSAEHTSGVVAIGVLDLENTNISNITIEGKQHVSGVFGTGDIKINNDENAKSTIKNINVTSNSTRDDANASAVVAIADRSGGIKNIDLTEFSVINKGNEGRSAAIASNGTVNISNCNVSNGEVKNTGNEMSSSLAHAGGITGVYSGNVNNCTITNVDVKSASGYVGGISGGSNGNISNCTVNDSTVNCSATGFVGGIVGHEHSNISIKKSDVNNSTISNVSGNIGGIAGYASGKIEQSNLTKSTVSTTGTSSFGLGGIVGQGYNIGNNHTEIINCNVTDSKLSGNVAVGGIAGAAVPSITGCKVIGTNDVSVLSNSLKTNEQIEEIDSSNTEKQNSLQSNNQKTEADNAEENNSENVAKDEEKNTEDSKTVEEETKDNNSEETKESSNQNNIADLVSTQTIIKQEDNNKVVLNDANKTEDKIVNEETEDNTNKEDKNANQDNSITEEEKDDDKNNEEIDDKINETKVDENINKNEVGTKQKNSKLNASKTAKSNEVKTQESNETEKEYSTTITGVAYIGGIIGYGGQLSEASYLPVTITDCAIQNIKVEGTHAVNEAIGEKSYYSGYAGTLIDQIINFVNTNSTIISKEQNP